MYCLKEKIPCGDPWNFDIQPVAYLNTMPLFRIKYDGNLMFFWPCIMNWLYINYQLDALTIIYS